MESIFSGLPNDIIINILNLRMEIKRKERIERNHFLVQCQLEGLFRRVACHSKCPCRCDFRGKRCPSELSIRYWKRCGIIDYRMSFEGLGYLRPTYEVGYGCPRKWENQNPHHRMGQIGVPLEDVKMFYPYISNKLGE